MTAPQSTPQWTSESWRLAFTNAPIGCALVGLDGRWLQVNDALCAIVGYSASELSTLTSQDITHPDDLDTDLALVKALVAGDVPNYRMEKRYLRADGTPVWISQTVSLVHDAGGEPSYFILQIEDIDRRRTAADAVRNSEQRLQSLTDSIADAIVAADVDGVITAWNPAAATTFGHDRTEAVGQSLTLIIPERFRAAHTAALRRLGARGAPRMLGRHVEMTALKADGDEFPVEMTVNASLDPTGKPAGYTAVIRDISGRRQFEDLTATVGALLQSSDDAIIASTLEGVITLWSPGAERLYGYGEQEAVGMPVTKLFPVEAEWAEIVSAVMERDGASFNRRRVHKDGHHVAIAVTAQPVRRGIDVIGLLSITRVIPAEPEPAVLSRILRPGDEEAVHLVLGRGERQRRGEPAECVVLDGVGPLKDGGRRRPG